MLSIKKIDWNQLWQQDRPQREKPRDREFWNKRAPSFADHTRSEGYDDYVDPFLKIIAPQPDWSVLDVGCGAGTMAHPLSKLVKHVTAIDFSPAMLDLLQQYSRQQGIANIDTHLLAWEDDWAAAGVKPHDVAIASRSLAVNDDVEATLRKLSCFARQWVFITLPVGNGPSDSRVLDAVGRPRNDNPDYIYIYNLLYQLGVYANVSIIERAVRTFSSREAARDSMRWLVEPMTSSEESAYRQFMDASLYEANGGWAIQGEPLAHWAALWWRAEALHEEKKR